MSLVAPEAIELIGAPHASDTWSLGCAVIEIELLTGRPLYADIPNGMPGQLSKASYFFTLCGALM